MANGIDRVNRSRRGARAIDVVVGLTLVLSMRSMACAHPEWSAIRVNRYAKLVLAGRDRIQLVYTILYGEAPALAARKSVDLDEDGRIDDKEKALLGARAAAAVAAGLHLSLDGRPVRLVPTSTDVGLAGDSVAPEPYSVDLGYTLVLPSRGPHELGLDDKVEVSNEGDTELTIEESGAMALLEARRGRIPPGADAKSRDPSKEKVFTFRGPRFSVLEDRSITLRVAANAVPLLALLRLRAPLVAGLLALLIAGLWWVRGRSRYRNMKG